MGASFGGRCSGLLTAQGRGPPRLSGPEPCQPRVSQKLLTACAPRGRGVIGWRGPSTSSLRQQPFSGRLARCKVIPGPAVSHEGRDARNLKTRATPSPEPLPRCQRAARWPIPGLASMQGPPGHRACPHGSREPRPRGSVWGPARSSAPDGGAGRGWRNRVKQETPPSWWDRPPPRWGRAKPGHQPGTASPALLGTVWAGPEAARDAHGALCPSPQRGRLGEHGAHVREDPEAGRRQGVPGAHGPRTRSPGAAGGRAGAGAGSPGGRAGHTAGHAGEWCWRAGAAAEGVPLETRGGRLGHPPHAL